MAFTRTYRHYNPRGEGKERANHQVDAFLDELLKLYKKHGVSLAHEDSQGGFILQEYKISNIDWIRELSVELPDGKKGK